MNEVGAARRCASRWVLTALAAMVMALLMALPATPAAASPGPVVTTTVDAVATGAFIDVFAVSTSAALEVDGQDGKFPTTVMAHDAGSTRFYARLSVAPGQTVTSVVVRASRDVPPGTATADVRTISITQATYDGTTLTVAASAAAPAGYPLRVEAGGIVGELPSPAPVSFPLTAPPASITVSSSATSTTAPVVVTGSGTAATTTAHVAATALTAPRGVATVIDGRGSTDATAFRTVIKSGPQGAVLLDDTTSTPKIVLPTWAAATDVLPRVAPAATPTVVTFTASAGGASSSIDVTVTPAGDTVAVTTARSVAGAELRVDGTSTIPGVTPPPDAPTQVVVYPRTSPLLGPTGTEPGWVKVGSAAVDPVGAFSVRSSPAEAYAQYLVQTSRGTLVTGPLGP
jgi:hypothetical protein